ncbi:MAG: glycosyltransferase [candidate division NC10 bacterium]|nr:glycosyltransferase [candidate division NC10 bacterium]
MRIVYLTIDNINDNVILAQTFPLLGRLAGLPGMGGIDLFGLRKDGGDRYRAYLPPARMRIRVGKNHGIWHPLTLFHLLRFALAAWAEARPGTVLVGRNPVSLLCLSLAALRHGTRLVLDYRGLLSEEYVLQGKIARRGRMHRLLRRLERWAIRRADAILCVSERLRERAVRWQPATAGKIVVIPCCYDPRVARRDEAAIQRLRAELALDPAGDFVLTYAGSLSAWSPPEAILRMFHAFREVHARTRLLLLTGDLEVARASFGDEAGILIRSVPHETIQHYLALADLGLLLRDRSSVNRVACPVKFAEYLACGVPVLVSPGVGDCPGIARRERVGYVLDADVPLSRIVSEIRASRSDFRVRCREAAMRYFDGDAYLALYGKLVGGKALPPLPESPSVGKACA